MVYSIIPSVYAPVIVLAYIALLGEYIHVTHNLFMSKHHVSIHFNQLQKWNVPLSRTKQYSRRHFQSQTGNLTKKSHHNAQLRTVAKVSDDDVIGMWRSMALFSHGKEWPADITRSINSLNKKLESTLPSRAPRTHSSYIEQRFGEVVRNMIRESKISSDGDIMTMNECIYGFEADLVLRVPDPYNNQEKRIVNIEIDGVDHDSPKARLYDTLRDKYLTEKHGVVVRRIKLGDERRRLEDEELKNILIKVLRNKSN